MPGTIRLHRVLRAPPERVYRAFLDADAMLAGQASADLDAQLQDFRAERLGALEFALVGIEDDQRVHVAVACVENIGDLEPVLP